MGQIKFSINEQYVVVKEVCVYNSIKKIRITCMAKTIEGVWGGSR